MLTTRRPTRRLIPLSAAAALVLSAAVVPSASAAEAVDPVTIDIVGINDFHGRLEASGTVAGAAVLAGAVDALRAANPSTVFVSAGDNIGASTFTSFIQQDNPTIDALNAMGLQVSALGNHEFDQGRTDVDDRVLARATFPHLAANLYDTVTNTPAYAESWVTDVDGVTVGFIGAVTAGLPSLVSPAGISTLQVRPVVTEVNRVAANLSDGEPANGEADVVVLLVHEGPDTGVLSSSTDASVFGQIVAGVGAQVDAIFSGHTHQTFAHQVPVAGWPAGLTRPVVQSGSYGTNLDKVTLTVDRATGDVVANASAILPLAPGGVAAYPADPEVAAIVASAVAAAAAPGAVSLGQITADLNRARTVAGAENRGGESTLSNAVADAQLWATRELGTQIAFMNPGGLRANIAYAATSDADPAGNVTFKEAATVQPFANTLVTQGLTGAQVVQVLEEQWQPAGSARPFLKLGVAGLTYTYDPTAAAGHRVTQVLVAGVPLDLAATYTVVANSFLASGGDSFFTLAAGTNKADSGRIDLQAFVDYMAAVSPLSPDLAQRAVGVQLVGVPAGGYVPGQAVTVNLSSLAFSAGEVQPTEVTLSTGGTTLGTFPIDPTIVDTTDEVGRATVTFAVPERLVGTTLTVDVTTASGTVSAFTVPLAVLTCSVEYDALRLGRNFLAGVTVHNETATAVRGWTLTWTYTQAEKLTAGIGVKARQSGTLATATSTRVTSTIRPDGAVSFALIGKAPNGIGNPAGFALNGQPCLILP